MTTGLPRKPAKPAGLPLMSVNATSGAGSGAAARLNCPNATLVSAPSDARAGAVNARRNKIVTPRDNAEPRQKDQRDRAAGEANSMWGGRFAGGPAAIMRRINASIDFDKRLYAEDIAGSQAHCAMLVAQGIISPEDGAAICRGLEQIWSEIESGVFVFSEVNEDIHLNIEARLAELIGPSAGRLHTARSRNDQVAVDFRLWVKRELQRAAAALTRLIAVFLDRAEEHAATVMPGFTHLQSAQPVTFGHHCMAYVEMFARDLSRVGDAIERMDESPLGAAALAGTSFPIDRNKTD